MKPRGPRRCSSIRAKKPAIRKKVGMRKAWITKNSQARAMLGRLSTTTQPMMLGTNDMQACSTTPPRRA